MNIVKLCVVSTTLALGGFVSSAHAVTCELTGLDLNNTCTVNGAIYQEGSFNLGAGTGVFPSFVQVTGNNEVKSAYNTTDNNTLDNGAANNFNRAIQLQSVSLVNEFGGLYYEFFLDINQNAGGASEFLSLTEVQIFSSAIANQNVETFTGGLVDINGSLRYRLDAGTDSVIKLEYGLHPGSATADMRLLVPMSAFALDTGSSYIYLFSEFGRFTWTQPGQTVAGGTNNDGFEEWALRAGTVSTCPPGFVGTPPTCRPPDQVPEPGTLALLGLGLLGLSFGRRQVR